MTKIGFHNKLINLRMVFFVDPSESDSDGDPHPTHSTVSAAFTTAIDDTLWMGLGPWDSLHKLGPITMVYYGYNHIYIYPLITGSALPSTAMKMGSI